MSFPLVTCIINARFDFVGEENRENEEKEMGGIEFVVRKLLSRRLIMPAVGSTPRDKDYEYLVSWEGYTEEDNSWEPFQNVKHCTDMLKELQKREAAAKLRDKKFKNTLQRKL